jgi:hypothetical protein
MYRDSAVVRANEETLSASRELPSKARVSRRHFGAIKFQFRQLNLHSRLAGASSSWVCAMPDDGFKASRQRNGKLPQAETSASRADHQIPNVSARKERTSDRAAAADQEP